MRFAQRNPAASPQSELQIREQGGVVSFAVRVQPRASREEIGGVHDGALKIRLTAPPVGNRANEALRRLLASRLKLPLSAVKIAAGERNRTKRVEITGAKADAIRALA
ncbi:MAG TPA: DUF167 domain-containing protein [Methylomirabilota bacterium]|nr:DUF167 domain-containing protein [Methylomirabilota bacterium]